MTDQRPPEEPDHARRRPHPLSVYRTSSAWKRTLLIAGVALVAIGLYRSGVEPDAFRQAGIGAFAGYLIGRTVRNFAKVALIAGAAVVGLAAVVSYSGLVPADQLASWKSAAHEALAGAGTELHEQLMHIAPAGVLTTIGLFAGLGRR